MIYDVTQSPYNAVGDGSTDDRGAIQSAIDDAELAGGGIVYFPQGDYLLDSQTTTDICLMGDSDRVKYRGDGVGLSILKLGDDVDGHMLNLGAVAECEISGLEFDGNRANQPASKHCIRSSDDWTNVLIRDVYCHDASGYGIGLQFGSLVAVTLEDVLVEDTGSDGIDIKNGEEGNRNCRMNNVTVRRAGLNTSLTGQACIDVRGIWNLNSIIVEDFNNSSARCTAGIRFRTGPGENPTQGAMWSTLTNFYIKGTVDSTVNGITAEAYQVQIVGGQILACGKGILFNGPEVGVGDVTARECTYGFFMDTDSNGTNLTGCTARSNSSTGFYVKSDGCTIIGLQSRGNAYGISLQSTSQNTVLSGVSTTNSTSNLYTESGHTKNSTGLIS